MRVPTAPNVSASAQTSETRSGIPHINSIPNPSAKGNIQNEICIDEVSHSLKNITDTDIESLIWENNKLIEINEYLEKQFNLTKEVAPNQKSSPLVVMTTTRHGILRPQRSRAVFTAYSIPPQQGTSMRTTVIVLILFCLNISVSFSE